MAPRRVRGAPAPQPPGTSCKGNQEHTCCVRVANGGFLSGGARGARDLRARTMKAAPQSRVPCARESTRCPTHPRMTHPRSSAHVSPALGQARRRRRPCHYEMTEDVHRTHPKSTVAESDRRQPCTLSGRWVTFDGPFSCVKDARRQKREESHAGRARAAKPTLHSPSGGERRVSSNFGCIACVMLSTPRFESHFFITIHTSIDKISTTVLTRYEALPP